MLQRGGAVRAVVVSGLLTVAADGTVIACRAASGELTPMETQQQLVEAATKGGAVSLSTAGALLLGANPVGVTVVVVGGITYIVMEYGIDEFRSVYRTSPMTRPQLEKMLPTAWHLDEL